MQEERKVIGRGDVGPALLGFRRADWAFSAPWRHGRWYSWEIGATRGKGVEDLLVGGEVFEMRSEMLPTSLNLDGRKAVGVVGKSRGIGRTQ